MINPKSYSLLYSKCLATIQLVLDASASLYAFIFCVFSPFVTYFLSSFTLIPVLLSLLFFVHVSLIPFLFPFPKSCPKSPSFYIPLLITLSVYISLSSYSFFLPHLCSSYSSYIHTISPHNPLSKFPVSCPLSLSLYMYFNFFFILLPPLLSAGTLWNLSSYEPLKMVIINHGLQTMTNEVIIPHSGWEHEPNEDSKPRDAEWTTVFKNTSGCLR